MAKQGQAGRQDTATTGKTAPRGRLLIVDDDVDMLNLVSRWRSEFDWVATFGSGEVGGEFVMDGQLSYRLPDMNAVLKAGVNNIFGENYTQMYGSVDIGRIFYVSLSYDSFLK